VRGKGPLFQLAEIFMEFRDIATKSTVTKGGKHPLKHLQSSRPALSLTSPTTFGQIGGGGTPRNMEFGIRIPF
jgi:hypothetical protein